MHIYYIESIKSLTGVGEEEVALAQIQELEQRNVARLHRLLGGGVELALDEGPSMYVYLERQRGGWGWMDEWIGGHLHINTSAS